MPVHFNQSSRRVAVSAVVDISPLGIWKKKRGHFSGRNVLHVKCRPPPPLRFYPLFLQGFLCEYNRNLFIKPPDRSNFRAPKFSVGRFISDVLNRYGSGRPGFTSTYPPGIPESASMIFCPHLFDTDLHQKR